MPDCHLCPESGARAIGWSGQDVALTDVYDYDFHPNEGGCRLFVTPPEGVLRLDDHAFVTEVRWDRDRVLRHYAFADRWVKVNVSRSKDGHLLDLNCDIATPMQRDGDRVYSVDLFIDVLVEADGRTNRVQDEDEFEDALSRGLISPAEASAALRELGAFTHDVAAGRLVPWLESICPFGPPVTPPNSDMRRVPVPAVLRPPRSPMVFQ